MQEVAQKSRVHLRNQGIKRHPALKCFIIFQESKLHIMETHVHNFQDFLEVLVLIKAISAITGGMNINCLREESIIFLK